MNRKKARKLRKGVEIACAGQRPDLVKAVGKWVKKNHKFFKRSDSLTVIAMKMVQLIKAYVAEKKVGHRAYRRDMENLGNAGNKAAKAGATLNKSLNKSLEADHAPTS